jgi:asparagine synthase (glutamine-hydrolysing)
MSAQFGRWSFSGLSPAPGYLEKASQLLAPFGPDGGGSYSVPGVDIMYKAFHTTWQSHFEQQPYLLRSGTILTWDGRLDNREELFSQLNADVTVESTDVAFVAAAFERWGTNCFTKLVGDWALSIWEPTARMLILAKDFLGARRLYYAHDSDRVTWSTILDPLVLLAGRTLRLEEEYIAGWLSFFPATHLTPYVGIRAVPPSTFVRLRPGQEDVTKYWNFDAYKRIRYSTDREYEEHFRTIFRKSIARRLRSDAPVLAELSGGIDSSSIVCVADKVIAQGHAETPRLDTVSYYDDSEPNWNERPYFTRVEEYRGRAGWHIDVASEEISILQFEADRFAAAPEFQDAYSESSRSFAACLVSGGNRVVLSGIGGDEVTGGVPTPVPEFADILATARFLTLARKLKAWALEKRRPWFYLLLEAARSFFPAILFKVPEHRQPAAWLDSKFVARHRLALSGYQRRLRVWGPLPSFQGNLNTLGSLQRQVGCGLLASQPTCENSYPYLDRDLLELIYAIPREQLVRPGYRRSLMRRALAAIVPPEILNRKRKAFVVRRARSTLTRKRLDSVKTDEAMISGSLGIIDWQTLSQVMLNTQTADIPIITLMRTLALEAWLRNLIRHKVQFAAPERSCRRGVIDRSGICARARPYEKRFNPLD